MRSTQLGSFIFLLCLSISHELKCYEGSKGQIKGETTRTFVEQQCEEGMQYCFESFNYDQTEVTAQCQLRSTDQKLLDICKVGCVNHTDVRIVICCCDHDLCNTSPYNFTTPEDVNEEESTTTTILTTTTVIPSEPLVVENKTENSNETDTMLFPIEDKETILDLKIDDEPTKSAEELSMRIIETIPPQSGDARRIRKKRANS